MKLSEPKVNDWELKVKQKLVAGIILILYQQININIVHMILELLNTYSI